MDVACGAEDMVAVFDEIERWAPRMDFVDACAIVSHVSRTGTVEGLGHELRSWKAGVGLCALAAVFAVSACSDLRVKEDIYTNLDEARAAGAIQSGWIPNGLPADVSDMREGHLPDGRHWGVFTFAPRDTGAVQALVGPEITTNAPSCDAPGRLEWWPELLHTPIDLDRVRSTGFRLYSDRAGQLAFAINWGQGRAYYWRG